MTASTLRAWENRFGVPHPVRTEGGQRLYSLDEVEKVRRVRDLVRQGWAVGAAAEYTAGSAEGRPTRGVEDEAPVESVLTRAPPEAHVRPGRSDSQPAPRKAGRQPMTALVESMPAGASESPLTASIGTHDPKLLEVAHQATRALLVASSPREVVSVIVGVVHGLDGYTAPARLADDSALPIDISLGEGEPVLPLAPAMSVARLRLEQILPMLLEDARRVIELLRRAAATP